MKVDHVEPVQSLTPNRGTGARSVLTVAVPIVALVAVVAGGVLGQTDEPVEAVRSTPGPNVAAVESPRPDAEDPGLAVDIVEAGFPGNAIGLPVRSVEATVERIQSGRMRESVVAVAGWLTIRPPRDDCPNEYDRGTGPTSLCPRDTVLLGSPEPFLALEDEEVIRLRRPGVHLHPEAMPGVPIASVAGLQYHGLERTLTPIPVVLVGRIDDPRLPDCMPSARGCTERLSLERLIWVNGDWQEHRALEVTRRSSGSELEPAAQRKRISESVRGAGTLLSEILVPRDALRGLDAGADRAVDETTDGPVWYVRVLIRVVGPGGSYPRDVGWAVIDDATGRVLAAHPSLLDVTASR